ncbi:MAG TPA: hypothetical protein VD772_00735, partial [Anseongella sp.]|nr:hypothetical protein [Anseongella sp.]
MIFDGRRLHSQAVLVLEDDGTVVTLLPQEEGRSNAGSGSSMSYDTGGRDAEYFEGLLTPGFINAHCHLELSHMKGLLPKG